jgi:lipid II:glycine glycyltransferase (peptidoglycan interpeptide bridge formation enzyme)
MAMFEMREIKNEAEYNPLIISKDAPFTQGLIYGKWQEMMDRKVRRFEIRENSETVGFFQVIRHHLPFSKNLLYIPHGPILRQGYGGQAGFLDFLKEKFTKIAKEEKAIFVRFDIFPSLKERLNKYFRKVPDYAYQSVYFQPKFERVIDLNKSEDELLQNMHPKTRYNIHLAERKGIEIIIIKKDFENYFERFFALLKETANRDKFKLHLKIYYQNIFKTLNEKNAFLIVAKYKDKVLLINLILLFGDAAYFIFGGSSDEYKNLMAPHLTHWRAIIEARRHGLKIYNFGAVSGKRYKNFEGISVFKERFGGRLVEYSDSYDLVLKPFWYKLYNLRKWLLNRN